METSWIVCGKGEIYVCETTVTYTPRSTAPTRYSVLNLHGHTRRSLRVQAMETNRKVRVTTAELDKWGAHSWDITFLSGDAYTPPGTHNYDPLVLFGTDLVETGKFDGGTCISAPQCKAPAAVSALLSVTTTQDGSQELGGTFTLFIGTPNPLEDVRVLPFDASPDRVRLELQELSTVDTVFVTRIPYRDPVLGDEVCVWARCLPDWRWTGYDCSRGRRSGITLGLVFVCVCSLPSLPWLRAGGLERRPCGKRPHRWLAAADHVRCEPRRLRRASDRAQVHRLPSWCVPHPRALLSSCPQSLPCSCRE